MTGSQDFFGGLLFTLMVAGNFIGMLVASHILGGVRAPSKSKDEPFECGYPSDAPAPRRFPVSFYLAGLLLLIFDVETVFLYPWAVEFRGLGLFGFVEMLTFVGMLLLGYVYLLRRGALRW